MWNWFGTSDFKEQIYTQKLPYTSQIKGVPDYLSYKSDHPESHDNKIHPKADYAALQAELARDYPDTSDLPRSGNNPQVNPMAGRRVVKDATKATISHCTKVFAYAQRNPFDAHKYNVSEVCMPDAVVLPTEKVKLITRGNGATGTTGYGFVVGNPYRPVNDQSSVQCTTSSSVFTNATTLGAATNLSSVSFTESNFANADLAAGAVEYRTCAFGIRVRYTGTHDEMGGTVIAYRSPSNTNENGHTFDEIASNKDAQRYPFGREWVSVVYKVATPTDTDFAASVQSVQPMVLLIHSAIAGATFEFESVIFVEYVGSNVNRATASHSDPVGYSAVQAVTTRMPDSFMGPGPSEEKMCGVVAQEVKNTSSWLGECASKIAPVVGAGALYAAKNYVVPWALRKLGYNKRVYLPKSLSMKRPAPKMYAAARQAAKRYRFNPRR